MIVPYSPAESADYYDDYYAKQVGHGVSVYTGKTVMDGNRIGALFKGLFRAAVPVLKKVATKAIVPAIKRSIVPLAKWAGKSLLKSGVSAVGDLMTGDFSDRREERRAQRSTMLKAAMADAKRTAAKVKHDVLRDVKKELLHPMLTPRRKGQRTKKRPGVNKKHRSQRGRNIFF